MPEMLLALAADALGAALAALALAALRHVAAVITRPRPT
jgi:hypothetical protein